MADSQTQQLIEQIHASLSRGVLAVTGGGSSAISDLLGTPGASRTVLEAVVPYSEPALREWIGGRYEGACTEETARAMATASLARARQWADVPGFDTAEERGEELATCPLFGIGATAALVTDRPKRGPHRVHVAVQTIDRTIAWSLELDKGSRTRAEEEAVASPLILHAVATACGIVERDDFASDQDGDAFSSREIQASPLWSSMAWGYGLTALIDPAADRQGYSDRRNCYSVFFPGSFNPPHEGHRKMIEVSERLLGKPAVLELSVTNVDKPPLDFLSIDQRLEQIARLMPEVEVWLTCMPTFVRKSQQFRDCTYIVGADTVTRIGDSKYYDDDPAQRDAAVATLAERGCRFLVFGREREDEGPFVTLSDLNLPPALRAICDEVSEAEFRADVSSTELREQNQSR